MIPYEPPEHNKNAFNCPLCGTLTSQDWDTSFNDPAGDIGGMLKRSTCFRCRKYSIWHRGRMIYPASGAAPLPNADLPGEIMLDYEEARSIASLSPRGAAALLRLAIQKLCDHLGAKGKDLNEQIGYWVEQGLDPLVQKSLDSVRVIGNEAVHPGQIDLKDDQETAATLFELANLIAERMITYPKLVEEMYQRLPESKRKAIEKRDKPKTETAGNV